MSANTLFVDLGEEPMRLARDERRDMVRMLSEEGLSTRAIAPIVGVSQSSVDRDRQPTRSGSVEPRVVEGLDGRTRTYTRPAPVEPVKRKRHLRRTT